MINIFRFGLENGRGGFKSTLRRFGVLFILIGATSTSPFEQIKAVASSSQVKQAVILQDIKVPADRLSLKLLESTPFSTSEFSIEASLGDLLKQPDYKDFKKIKIIGKARIITPTGGSRGIDIQGAQSKGSPLGQVVWSHVAIKEKGQLRTQSLHKPLTSSFKAVGTHLKAGSILKAQGCVQALIMDAKKLIKGKGSEIFEQVEQPQTAFSAERRVDGSGSQRRTARSKRRGNTALDESFQQAGSTVTANFPSDREGGARSSSGTPKTAPGNQRTAGSLQTGDRGSQFSNVQGSHNRRPRGNQSSSINSSSSGNSGLNACSHLGSGDTLDAARRTSLNTGFRERPETSPEPAASPTTEVRIAKEGCTPRVDLVQGRVVIRSRVQTFQDGNMIKEDPCTDTLETYPIKKDYRCEDCADLVDFERRVAYARFRYYWLDGEERRHEISAHLETDESRPYPFIEETSLCAPELDIPHNLAYRQAETVYFNRSNGRIKVAECRRLQGAPPVPMTLTHQGCTPVHDFAANRSKERKRLIFNIDGIEHVALPCHKADPALAHEFVTSVCAPIHDLSRNLVTPMARRRIRTSKGLEFITDECEPYGQSQALKSTAQGCEGEYVHDFEAGKSYLKKRWYHTLGGSPSYLTGCLRSDDFLTHQIEIKGYRHDDPVKVSRPKTALFITPHQSQKIEISRPQVRSNAPTTPYVLVREEQRPSARQPTVEGGYRLTHVDKVHIYRRADSSIFEIVAGEGTPRRDLIAAVPPAVIAPPTPEVGQRETEMSYSAEYKVDRGRRWNSGIVDSSMTFKNLRTATAVFGAHQGEIARLYTRRLGQSRTKITYPSGRVEYTGWQSVGPVSDWSLMNKRD